MIQDLVFKIDPMIVAKRLDSYNWAKFPTRRTNVIIFQDFLHGEMRQVVVPLDKEFVDFCPRILEAIRYIAKEGNYPSEEYVILELAGEKNCVEYLVSMKERLMDLKQDEVMDFLQMADFLLQIQTDAEKIAVCAVKMRWKNAALEQAEEIYNETGELLKELCKEPSVKEKNTNE